VSLSRRPRRGRSVLSSTGRLSIRGLGALTAAGVAAWLGAAGCSHAGENRARTPRRPSLVADGALVAPFPSPARLRYHPRERARARAERALADGRRLIVGERGERWVFDAAKRTLVPGAHLAPESLIAALGDGETFWFVGASGTSYAARGPLSPFERSSAPVETLNGVSAAGSSVVGVRQARSLLRSADFGATWTGVGPSGVRFVDVALDGSGAGLALAVPEALYRTQDFGASWQLLAAPSLGALELDVDATAAIRVVTPFREQQWSPAGGFAPVSAGSSAAALPAPSRGPSAPALAEGRAVMNGSAYLELARGERGVFQLLAGAMDGPLEETVVREASGCRAVRLAAFERFVVFACFRGSAESATQPIELYASDDSGKHFARVRGQLDGSLASFRLAVGAAGRWIATGVCPPSAPGAGCGPAGIQHARSERSRAARPVPGAKKVDSAGWPSAAPSLLDSALSLSFASDGRTAYAVGRRTKTNRFALFVSRDAGESFEPEDLDLGQFAAEGDGEDIVERSSGTRVESTSAAEDGAVAITFSHYGRRTLVVTDDQGKQLSSSEPPEERALVGATGLRAIAVAAKSRQIWESLDGGVTWQPSALLPIDLCPGEQTCDVPVRCEPRACVIGDELTRIVWGREGSESSVVLLPPLRPVRGPSERRLLAPISCVLDAAPFRELPGVSEPPGAHQAALGKTDWYAVGEDANRASVTAYHATRGRIEPVRLLDAAPRPEERAYAVLEQVEGAAAVRYKIADGASGRVDLTDVELVWDNLLEGRVGRAHVASAGPHMAGDYVTGRGRALSARPELVSIAAGGLYVRLHQPARSEQPTLFVDGKRVESVAPVSWPKSDRYPGRAELVHIGGAHVPVFLLGRGAGVVRARRSDGSWTLDAAATGMADPGAFGLLQVHSIAYVGGHAGLFVETLDATGANAEAALFPFRADGAVVDPPLALPTQRLLGDRPETCDAERRAKTPRVVSAFQPGTRHPVVVSDAVEGPRAFVTGGAVLHGTPEAPCALAFDAAGIAAEPGQTSRESALISLDALEHSTLFRAVGERDSSRIEYRTMACRFDPALEIPPEVYRAIGTADARP